MNVMVVASILIQLRTSISFDATQMFPLPRLLSFTLVFLLWPTSLCSMLIDDVYLRKIKGLCVEEIGEQYTHGQFDNDMSIIVEAKMEYVEETFSIFRCMGQSFGLYIKEIEIQVVLISKGPLPKELMALDWNWEDELNPNKAFNDPIKLN